MCITLKSNLLILFISVYLLSQVNIIYTKLLLINLIKHKWIQIEEIDSKIKKKNTQRED